MSNFRIVECAACGGEGRILVSGWVYEHGCGVPHRDLLDDGRCDLCDGTGGEIIETEPVTLEDLEELATMVPA